MRRHKAIRALLIDLLEGIHVRDVPLSQRQTVVDSQDASKLLGMLRRKDAIGVYNRVLAEHKQAIGDQA